MLIEVERLPRYHASARRTCDRRHRARARAGNTPPPWDRACADRHRSAPLLLRSGLDPQASARRRARRAGQADRARSAYPADRSVAPAVTRTRVIGVTAVIAATPLVSATHVRPEVLARPRVVSPAGPRMDARAAPPGIAAPRPAWAASCGMRTPVAASPIGSRVPARHRSPRGPRTTCRRLSAGATAPRARGACVGRSK